MAKAGSSLDIDSLSWSDDGGGCGTRGGGNFTRDGGGDPELGEEFRDNGESWGGAYDHGNVKGYPATVVPSPVKYKTSNASIIK